MYYSTLNDKGKKAAMALAKQVGLEGSVSTEYTPWGERCAFFKLKEKAVGVDDCREACRKLEAAGFDADYLFMGTPPEVLGGFIGKRFSDKASQLKEAEQ